MILAMLQETKFGRNKVFGYFFKYNLDNISLVKILCLSYIVNSEEFKMATRGNYFKTKWHCVHIKNQIIFADII